MKQKSFFAPAYNRITGVYHSLKQAKEKKTKNFNKK